MDRNCDLCGSTFNIDQTDLDFYSRISPTFGDRKRELPAPKNCPSCRLQRRLVYRNQTRLFKTKAFNSSEEVFTTYTPDVPFPIVKPEDFFSGAVDGLSFGSPFNPNRSFFAQLQELNLKTPHLSRSVVSNENSDYCAYCAFQKNCYMVFGGGYNEDCMYCENITSSRDCLDCTRIFECELCYECVECTRCYELQRSEFCEDCSSSYYLSNCYSCSNCFGCTNLSRREFCVYNQQYSKEEYLDFLSSFDPCSREQHEALQAQQYSLIENQPRPHMFTSRTENVTGNLISSAKNVHDSFLIRDSENLRYCFYLEQEARDCYDFSIVGVHSELMYECVDCGMNSQRILFASDTWDGCSDLSYCRQCVGCTDCFGCIGLYKKQFCILNQQYSADEYYTLVNQIVDRMEQDGEWGEFFPATDTAIPYNISMAQRYFPLSKEQIESRGFTWFEEELKDSADFLDSSKLPDNSTELLDPTTVLSSASGLPFRITSEELKRYSELKTPLPTETYFERFDRRIKRLGGLDLTNRKCDKTGESVLTTIPAESNQLVWKSEELDKEIFG